MKRTEDTEPKGSGCAGAAVLVVVGSGVLAGVWGAAPDVALLGLWTLGTGSVWWAVSRPNKIDNPSPPPPDDPSRNTKPQFRTVPDTVNPHRTHVVWDTTEGTTS